MNRHNSKTSVGSIESSRGGRKKESPTHVIIQRDGTDELLLLSVSHLVNGGLTRLKLNEKATFKVDLNGRKQERGVIISFGSEDICTEQMQVLNMDVPVDQENQNPIINNSKNHHEKRNEKRKEIDHPKSKPSFDKNQRRESNSSSSSTNNHSRVNDLKKMVSTNVGKDRAAARHHNDKTPQKNSLDDKEKPSSPTGFSSDENEFSPIATNPSRTHSIMQQQSSQTRAHPKNVNKEATSVPRRDIQSFDDNTTSSVEIDQQGEESIDDQSKDTDQRNPLANDLTSSSHELEKLSKKYQKLLKEYTSLQNEYDCLQKENSHLKRTTIPMPDPGARQWFINVAKLFSNDSINYDLTGHARRLDIADPKDLLECLQKTSSSTARHIVRLLYSRQQLLAMKGPDISDERRKAIRDAAEAHRGPISDHKFNEAVNGVFRSVKIRN